MKKLILTLLLLLNIAFASAFFSNPFSILDVSDLGNTNIQINLTNKEEIFCLQGGDCVLNSVTTGTFNLFLDSSIKKEINFNISQSDSATYQFNVTGGNHFVFGDTQ